MKLIRLYLMGEKGLKTLQAITLHYKKNISEVIIGSDYNVINDYSSEIQEHCNQFKIPAYPRSKTPPLDESLSLAISWRWMIPSKAKKLIILHDSILPKYRGFNPLVTALINGDSEVGVTALWAEKEYDSGEIVLQKKASISYPITIQEAIDRLTPLYIETTKEILETLNSNASIQSTPQDESMVSFSLWRDEEDYEISWLQSSQRIARQIDAQSDPYLGSICFLNRQKIRILSSEVLEDVEIANRSPGKIIFLKNDYPVVVCGKGLLMLTKIRDESNKNMLPLKKFRSRFK